MMWRVHLYTRTDTHTLFFLFLALFLIVYRNIIFQPVKSTFLDISLPLFSPIKSFAFLLFLCLLVLKMGCKEDEGKKWPFLFVLCLDLKLKLQNRRLCWVRSSRNIWERSLVKRWWWFSVKPKRRLCINWLSFALILKFVEVILFFFLW